MIISEIRVLENSEFYYHVSDNNKYIKKIGTSEIYSEVYDVIPCQYEYEETDIDIVKLPTYE